MEITSVGTTAKTPASNFTGDVWLTPIYSGQTLNVGLVRFPPGARTNWHRHPAGQTLHVTEGVGLVGTRDGQVARLRAGDTVVCPPDEEHWHGAAADTFLSHLALTAVSPGNEPAIWLEPVPQTDYDRASALRSAGTND